MPHRLAAALLVALLVLLGAAPAASAAPVAGAAPAQAACPQVNQPGPPVDESEAPRPGGAAPAPLPVPETPVGGAAMGTCGTVVPSGAPAPPEVGVQSYVVADLDSGAVLAAKVPHARLRPASLLKTLTGLLVAKQVPMDQVLVGTQDDANQEGTRVGIGPGGQYTVRQLFDAMLMASGNDAAHALAVRLTGSVPATVDLMNRTAADVGAHDTRAATPSGLDGPGQSSSAYDLASIFRLGMQQPAFAQAVGTRQIQFPGFGPTPPFAVDNDNKIFRYPGALGGKTGFTDDARHTYIGAQDRGGRRLVVVLMHGEQRPVPMVEQGLALLDYGYALPRDASVGRLTEQAPDDGSRGGSDASRVAVADAPDSPASGDTSWGTWLALGGVVLLGLVVLAARYRHRT
ncbi:D-alanyl-D-alanine carboxypeptidase family protein [Actinomycetospora corticicola]|uniref:D-alanyl-D-alanine carboxypeptidase (Penicillin-binding protein 5/6) n=1 Tax=Actinomycetospora corticicola TaxID=663602 RepID=A0A7Y9DXX8_9PSEU|nr:D-alanyl-D-alanine carboxypeptidase [Actinomycetospora corticicola]NYD37593.1 D-alanyl-D-alanine carboxypeptidase (penicillin-binding protein 5/6) [Actinomycetospora corticicola]